MECQTVYHKSSPVDEAGNGEVEQEDPHLKRMNTYTTDYASKISETFACRGSFYHFVGLAASPTLCSAIDMMHPVPNTRSADDFAQ